MKIFKESDRYLYDLTPESVVFDVGGYHGMFSREIHQRYGCRITCFEPVFFRTAKEELGPFFPKVIVLDMALGGKNAVVKMGVKGDSTGAMAQSDEITEVRMLDAVEVFDGQNIALLKLNCESGEFEILEAILDRGRPRSITHIQVQPHPIVPDYEARWQRIHERLLETHELKYHAPWCWSGYTLK